MDQHKNNHKHEHKLELKEIKERKHSDIMKKKRTSNAEVGLHSIV